MRSSSSGAPRAAPQRTWPRSRGAATHAAVDTLLVDIDEKLPGTVDDGGAVTFAEDDAISYGVVDEIAKRVLLAGGRVLAVRAPDLPSESPLAAILRYAP